TMSASCSSTSATASKHCARLSWRSPTDCLLQLFTRRILLTPDFGHSFHYHIPMITRRSVALFFIAFFALAADRKPAPLAEFIKRPDPAFKSSLAKTMPGEGYTAYVLDLTSQTWPPAAPDTTDHPVWKHWLTIIKPSKIDSTTGLLFISGGSVRDA